AEETTVSDMLRIPQRPFRLLLPLAAFLLGAEFLFNLIEALEGLRRGG
ncbi:MAG: TRAP transporter small permease, partial [Deltaproteobacteria bacterium]